MTSPTELEIWQVQATYTYNTLQDYSSDEDEISKEDRITFLFDREPTFKEAKAAICEELKENYPKSISKAFKKTVDFDQTITQIIQLTRVDACILFPLPAHVERLRK